MILCDKRDGFETEFLKIGYKERELSRYKMIAFDMDGTLLTTDQRISEDTQEAIREAYAQHKLIALSTGRSASELEEYIRQLPEITYAVMGSGALVFDLTTGQPVSRHTFTREQVDAVLNAASQEDVLLEVMSRGDMIIDRGDVEKFQYYHVGEEFCKRVRTGEAGVLMDLRGLLGMETISYEKINLFHRTSEGRERTIKRLAPLGLELASTVITMLEISPPGVTKAYGLQELCSYLNMDIADVIAVGDSDNDRQVLGAAGLPVAMGNAAEEIKAICRAVVADNDHDGCAEAIRRYLLD